MEIEMSPRLKDTLKALWGIKETDSKDQEGSPMEISTNILDGASSGVARTPAPYCRVVDPIV